MPGLSKAADKAFIVAALIKIGRHVQHRDNLIKQAKALNPADLIKSASAGANKKERLKFAALCAQILIEERQIEKMAGFFDRLPLWGKAGLGAGALAAYETARPYVASGLNTVGSYASYPFRSAYNYFWPEKPKPLPEPDYLNAYMPQGYKPSSVYRNR